MSVINCRPTDGTTPNSAPDSYNATHTFEDFDWPVATVDIRVKNNAAVVSFKAQGESSYGNDQLLPTGMHSRDFGSQKIVGVRIKNATAGNTAKYQITGAPE